MEKTKQSLDEIVFDLLVSYGCRALLGGGKGQFIMRQLKADNPQLYRQVMEKARVEVGR